MDDIPPPRPRARGGVVLPDDEGLARTRIRFLTSETVKQDEVRETILASWWRSKQSQVPADRIEVPYVEDHALDTPLIQGAEPLMRRLGDQLDGQPISLILTDQSGVVLSQRTGDGDLQRHLERVRLAPGFSYSEQHVGTNGIGTALEGRGPMHVFGHEHYAENLENLACAGVPIHHPISGKTIGAIDLTCWRKDAGKLLIALAKSAAEQIRQALLTTTSIRELELFQSYLQACRHSSGIVIALNDDVVMMNSRARQLLEPDDQSALLTRATETLAEGTRTATTVDLPSGTRVQLQCRHVRGADESVSGGVLHVKLIEIADQSTVPAASLPAIALPGMVGSAPLWTRCCHEADASYAWSEWLALVGEPGVGKYTLASCIHRRRNPNHPLHTLDAEDATQPGWLDKVRDELTADAADALIIRHVDRLDGATATALATTLREAKEGDGTKTPWVAMTLTQDAVTRPDLAELLALLPRNVHVPPLRYRIDDLRELVPFLLDKLCHSTHLRCSQAAMQLLLRSNWPGNVTQLYRVLKHVTQHQRRSGAIQPKDLPAEYHAVSRRPLTQLESMERDAIVQGLQDTQGNKVQAAKLLGISRATIYRKIHDYGIVAPEG
jgi:transcriptional regulator of acetoin/glycerol metabolism